MTSLPFGYLTAPVVPRPPMAHVLGEVGAPMCLVVTSHYLSLLPSYCRVALSKSPDEWTPYVPSCAPEGHRLTLALIRSLVAEKV